MRNFKLDQYEVTVKDYNSNFQIFIDGDSKSMPYDDCDDFNTNENAEAAYDEIIDFFNLELSQEASEKLMDELKSLYYPHSSEIFA